MKNGKTVARQDWENQKVCYLVCGTSSPTADRLTNRSPFYVTGVPYSDDAEQYCDEYNSEVQLMLENNDIPVWAPQIRCPSREQSIEIVNECHHDFSEFRPISKQERTFFRLIEDEWENAIGRWWCRDESRGLLFLIGELTNACGRVVIYDYREGVRVRTYEYLRKHCPQFPSVNILS